MSDPLVSPSTTVGPSTTAGPCTQRRAVLAALPGIVILPGILSACGMTEPPGPASTVQQTTSVPEPSTVPVSEVPVGMAAQIKVGDDNVIIAQPTEGEFVAYSARCTHQGGIVQVVEDLHLRCPLHGAEYDATDGSNTLAPAPRPLDVLPISESGGQLTIG